MAEKKQHKLVAADGGSERKMKEAKPVGSASGLRWGAVILWILGLAFEICAFLVLQGKINLNFMPSMYQLIGFIVLDLIAVVIGSHLWKKANHIAPASEANKVKFWLWNNLGLIASIVCFLPIVILLLTNKDLDKKTKTIATVVAIIALLIGGASSIDYNPVSSEQQQAAIQALGDEVVYWAPFGKVYHTHEDCGSLNQSDSLTYGTVEQAIAANRTRLCSFCARRDNITGVRTDEQ
ncbi:MAG: hypothetical protein II971_01690 [Firmicutes bacterium]|nr:hypothetical protein [Bacillota bacterium]